MRNETIISKGKYAHPQPEALISLKQYVFARNEKGKKQLMLRFLNERSEGCTGFEFVLSQMDARGKVISEQCFESAAEIYYGNATFGFDHPIPVDERCTDFRVRLVRASFGDYTYRAQGQDILVSYEKSKRLNAMPGAEKSRTAPRIHKRRIKMPWLCAIVALTVLVAVFATFAFLLHDFVDGKKTFSLSGVKYEFVTGEQGATEVLIIAYKGIGGDVLLPAEIEGYRVAGIREGAFRGNGRIRNVRVEALDIPANAFFGCTNLESIELSQVTSIGNDAFFGCNRLTELKADTLEKIGDRAFSQCNALRTVEITHANPATPISIGEAAFAYCNALNTVSIRQTILYPELPNLFANDTALQSLYLQNFYYTVPDVAQQAVGNGKLISLFGDTSPASLGSLNNVTIGYMDCMAPEFCAGFPALESVSVLYSEIPNIPRAAFLGCGVFHQLNVPNSIVTVGNEAFKGTALKSFNGGALTSIGESAFENCTALAEMTLLTDGTLSSIGKLAFSNCSSLKTIVIPAGVTALSEGIWKDCTALTSVSFAPASVIEEIPAQAFRDCFSLKSIELPATVHTVKERAFSGCYQLSTVNALGNVSVYGDGAFENCRELTQVPFENVRTIGAEAFAGTALVELALPAGLEAIGLGAFRQCTALEEISVPFLGNTRGGEFRYFSYIFGAQQQEEGSVVPASLKRVALTDSLTALPAYAFYGCAGVEEITLPQTVVEIGESAFAHCCALTAMDLVNISNISARAFFGSGLRSIVIPEAITALPDGIFAECVDLETVTLPLTMTAIGESAFYNCTLLSAISLPDSIETIGKAAFCSCTALRAISLPASLISLPEQAFESCSSLTTVIFPAELKLIGSNAFADCTVLNTVSLPAALQRIGRNAFVNCGALAAISLPQSLMTIESGAFKNTALLTVTIPGTVSAIGSGVFEGCVRMTELTLPFVGASSGGGSNANLGYLFGGSNESVLPATLTKVFVQGGENVTVAESAFNGCKYVEEIVFGEGVVSILNGAAANCPRLLYVSLPTTLSSVSSGAFSASYHLYEVENLSGRSLDGVFPYALEIRTSEQARSPRIAHEKFLFAKYGDSWYIAACDFSAQEVVMPTGIQYAGTTLQWKVPAYFFFNNNEVKTVFLPSAVTEVGRYAFVSNRIETVTFHDYAPVTTIYSYTFSNNSYLKTVSLPRAVQVIEEDAFRSCTALANLTLSASLRAIGDNAFIYCGSLQNVTLPSGVESVGNYAFYECRRLEEVALSASLKTLGEYAFASCIALRRVTCGNQLTDIGSFAFSGCRALSDVTLSTTLLRIGDSAFRNCDGLVQISLPNSVTTLGACAFYDCGALREIRLSSALQSIGNSAFYNCDALTQISMPNTVLTLGEYAFYDCDALASVVLSTRLTAILQYTFNDCDALTEITIPTSVRSVESYAFYSADSLKKVVLSSQVQTLGTNAFGLCYNLFDVYYNGSLPLRAGYVDDGGSYISYFAVVIHTNMNDSPSVEVKIGSDLTFRCWNGYGLLLSYSGTREELSFSGLSYNGIALTNIRIREGAFKNNTTLKKLTISGTVTQLQTGAFRNCDALVEVTVLGSGLTDLPSYAFAGCDYLRTVTLSNTIRTIAPYAFADCVRLQSIKMPTSLTEIGAYAFSNCRRLLSVTLYQNVSSIGSSAFYGCTQLFEVYDLTNAISVNRGYTSNGYVAYYAKAVFTSASSALEHRVENGCTFVCADGVWYLYACEPGLSVQELKIPAYTGTLTILASAFEGATVTDLFLPATLTNVYSNALTDIYGLRNIYFGGDSAKWNSVTGKNTSATVWYYATCVHETRQWTYDSAGRVQTAPCALTRTVKSVASCTQEGVVEITCNCSGCTYLQREVTPKLPHSFEEDTCTVCSAERFWINADNLEQLEEDGIVTNDEEYPFAVSGGRFTSTNKGNAAASTVSYLTIKVTNDSTLQLTYGVSSESGYDKLVISVNGVDLLTASGTKDNQVFTYDVHKDDVVVIRYSKDSSVNTGSDECWVQDLYFIS